MVRRAGIILICLAVLIVISYVSAAVGYLLGGPQYSARFTPAEAAYTVATLQALRKGDSEAAISLLETRLDGQIVEHSTFSPRLEAWLDIFPLVLAVYDLHPDSNIGAQLMARVAAYRSQHLSEAPTQAVRSRINAHLAVFQQSAPAAQQNVEPDVE